QGLAAQQVQGLYAGGAYVDGGDGGVAGQLLHAVFADVGVAAAALQGVVGALVAPLGQPALGDRGQEAEQGVGTLALLLVLRALGDVHQGGGVQGQHAAAFHQ